MLFGTSFNGLEFVTYVLIPAAMVLMVLVYIFFNIRIIIVTLSLDGTTMEDLDSVEISFAHDHGTTSISGVDVTTVEQEEQPATVEEEPANSKPKSLSMRKK